MRTVSSCCSVTLLSGGCKALFTVPIYTHTASSLSPFLPSDTAEINYQL